MCLIEFLLKIQYGNIRIKNNKTDNILFNDTIQRIKDTYNIGILRPFYYCYEYSIYVYDNIIEIIVYDY